MNEICSMLHTTSSSILHWVNGYTPCEIDGVDFRDRINLVLKQNSWSKREVSMRAGSDSMLHKVLNPEKKGGIKYPTIEKIEAIAEALRVSPAWLAFGDGPEISEETLKEMADYAASEIQPGLSIAQIRSSVASALREQLALRLFVGTNPDAEAEGPDLDTSAQSRAPTTGSEREELRKP